MGIVALLTTAHAFQIPPCVCDPGILDNLTSYKPVCNRCTLSLGIQTMGHEVKCNWTTEHILLCRKIPPLQSCSNISFQPVHVWCKARWCLFSPIIIIFITILKVKVKRGQLNKKACNLLEVEWGKGDPGLAPLQQLGRHLTWVTCQCVIITMFTAGMPKHKCVCACQLRGSAGCLCIHTQKHCSRTMAKILKKYS